MTTNSIYFPPPQCMQADDYAAADAARQRLAPKFRFRLLSSLSDMRRRAKSNKSNQSFPREVSDHPSGLTDSNELTRPSAGNADTIIDLDCSAISDFQEDKDVYRWAIIYENQRGITIFSTPYYSGLSLLPNDPLPFTVPSSSAKRSKQPKVSLAEYPLPDGTWRWVSKTWMIDMRTDSGEVQHDGFEYNWRFRKDNWSSDVGTLSIGGWVRRRRWVRLMMRPAQTVGEKPGGSVPGTPQSGYSFNSSFSEISNEAGDLDAQDVWSEDDVEQNWIRCHKLMKRLGRDGQKLELWKRWLGGYSSDHAYLGHILRKGKQVQQRWTEDEGPLSMQTESNTKKQNVITEGALPTLEHVAAVLRIHGDVILHSFIYPDSRAQFLELLGCSGLLPELNIGLGIAWPTTDIDFWSYVSGLDKRVTEDKARLEEVERLVAEKKIIAGNIMSK